MRTSPWVGGKLPAMTLTRVDLPAPLSPMSPRTSPDSSVRSTSLSAWMAPKCLDTDCSSRIGNPASSASAHAKSRRSASGAAAFMLLLSPSTRSARRARGRAAFFASGVDLRPRGPTCPDAERPSACGDSRSRPLGRVSAKSPAWRTARDQVRAEAMSGRGSAAEARGNRARQARPSRAARLTARELARPLARKCRRA